LVKLKNKKMNDALSPANIENSEEAKDLDMKMKAAQEKHKFRKKSTPRPPETGSRSQRSSRVRRSARQTMPREVRCDQSRTYAD